MRIDRVGLSVFGIWALAAVSARAAYDIPQHVIAGGGGSSAGGSYAITGTIGQSVLGQSSGGNYVVNGGFWGGGTNAALAYNSAVSRKAHGAAGNFDIAIDPAGSLTAGQPITIEPRAIGTGHSIVFMFSAPVTSASAATTVGTANVAFNGNNAIVSLTNVPNQSRVKVDLTNVNGQGVAASVNVGFLLGDVNGSRLVNSTDILTVKAASGQATTAANFKTDLNASGLTNSTDILTVKSASGKGL